MFVVLFLVGCSQKLVMKRDFSTPEAAFETWKGAATKLDLRLLVESYAQSARPSIEEELARTTQEALQAMRTETQRTQFFVEKVVFEENLAYMRIRRKMRNTESIEVITLIKEGSSWRLLP